MAQIVDLNELVPEDIVIRVGKPAKDYALPGDMPTETVFRLFAMFQKIVATQGDPDAVLDSLKGGFGDLEAELLGLFQQRNPSLKRLPFGIRGTGEVLKVVLSQLGLTVTQENPTPPKPVRRASSVKSRSRR